MFDIWPWIWWLVGILGVGGAIAFVVLAPAIALPLLTTIVNFLLSCKRCLIAIGIAALVIGADIHGRHKEAEKCRQAELAAVIRNQRIDLANQQQAAADEANRAIKIEVTADEQRKKDAAYIATLEARPSCALDSSDIGRDGLGVSDHKPGAGRKDTPHRAK